MHTDCTCVCVIMKLLNIFKFLFTSGGSVIILPSDKSMIIAVSVAAIILLILVLILMCWYICRMKNKYALYLAPNENFEVIVDMYNYYYFYH